MNAFFESVEAALTALAKKGPPKALRLLAAYAGRIVSIRGNDSADIALDDESIGGNGGLGGRGAVLGIPGAQVALQGGDRVRVGFEGAANSGSEITGWEQDRNADRGVARKGDKVPIATLLVTVVATPVPLLQLSITPAQSPFNPTPIAPIILSFPGATVISGIVPGVPYALDAWIATGSTEIMLRRLSTEEIP